MFTPNLFSCKNHKINLFAFIVINLFFCFQVQAQDTWTSRTSAADNAWSSITYGNNLFVAVATSGTGNRVMTSPDGITWTTRVSAANNTWWNVIYGNGIFVAVSRDGTGNRVMTSPDGITWTVQTSAVDNSWTGVTYGNGLFVAVASSGTGNRVMTSPDGISWTARTSAADNSWNSITYANGLFVAVSGTGTGNRVMTSPDGINWISQNSPADNEWNYVTFGNGLFVAVSRGVTGTGNRVMTSPDGITWTSRTSAADLNWNRVVYGNGFFVAVAASGTGNRVMTSPDGITWTSRTSAADYNWNGITYGNGLFVAVSNTGTGNRVMTSNAAVSRLTIDAIADQSYTGSPLTPAIVVKDGPTTLTLGTHYSVAYSNNTNEGIATVTITGMGNYTGTKSSTFTIVPPPTITSFSPASGPVGTLVTITGTNLGTPTAFTIGGTAAIVISNTGTTLVGMVMPGAVTGTISLTTAGGSVNSTGTFSLSAAPAPNTQQGAKLVGTGNIGAANQGYIVSISADGNTAIVGGDTDNSSQGAAWIFTRSGATWSQQGAKLVGTGAVGNAQQGVSVSLSADGNTAIVGGYVDNSEQGAAWIFTRSGTTWTQQGAKLVGTGAVGNARQGRAVSLSADGNTAIVSGNFDDSGVGAAWIFTRSGTTWSQQGAKLVGTGAVGNAQQGRAVSLSADGTTAIVGGNLDNSNQGAAWIFTRSGTTWSQQGAKLVGTGAVGAARQGTAVSLSADGTTAILGGITDDSSQGAVWVFTRSGTTWTQQGAKLVGTGNTGAAGQGIAVSISADGNSAFVGGYNDNTNQGAAWIFTRSGTTWSQRGDKLVGTGNTGAARQGTAVSISADGTTAIVGGYQDNSIQGAAWIYTYVPPPPTITSFTPTSAGSTATVTLTGTNFTGATAVNFGGTAATSFNVVSATSITAVIAAGTSGNVSVTTPGGTGVLAGFTFIPAPVITSFTPTSAATGATVTLTGTNFTGATAVSFGGTAATSFTVVSATSITAVIAAGTSGNVSVTTPGGTGVLAGFTFIPAPVITSFTPTSAAIGATVTLTGTNFTGATAVSFGGTAATSFNVVSATSIKAVIAAGTSGNVSVTTPGGTGVLAGFTFIPAPVITSFTPTSAAIGATVTLTGTNFTGATAVSFGGTAATSFNVVSATSITAVIAAGTSGNVSVTTPGGTGVLAGFTFTPAPVITSFTPTSAATGATVTLTGTNFTGATAVSFGGTAATSFTVVSATSITAVLAAGTSGNISVTTPGGTGVLAGFTVLSSNANLASLALSTGTLSPVFSSGTTSYTATVPFASSSITLTPTRAEGTASIKVKGVTVASGSASESMALAIGNNTINTVVTAGDGTTTKTYSIVITREGLGLSSNAELSAMSLSAGTLSPVFTSGTTSYTATVPFASSSITLTPTRAEGTASIKVNGVTVTSGSASASMALAIGNNTINTVVTAGDGTTTKTYSVIITRTEDPDIALVSLDKAALIDDLIKGTNTDLSSLTTAISLPSTSSNGSVITWTSSNPSVVSADGKTIIRPVFGSGDITVTLSATLTKGLITATKTFNITVLQLPNQAPAMNAIANQTLCYSNESQTIALSGINPGPETSQTTVLSVSSTNSSLFSGLSVVSGIGGTAQLRFTPVNTSGGTATLTVTVKDNGGKENGGVDTFIRTFTITINPLPEINISSNLGTTISKGYTAQLTASGGTSYTWSNAQGIISGQNSSILTVRPARTTTYTVRVSNPTTCINTYSITINVSDDYQALMGNNILTPNGDGENDFLVIKNLDMYPNHTLKIFNKVGSLIFTKVNYANDWDGSFNGSYLDQDTYFYIVDFNGLHKLKGFVSIVR